MNLVDKARFEAEKVLEKCITANGLYASGTSEGYTSVWARDSMISLLGGSLVGEKFKKVFEESLLNLISNQSELGQIPNATGLYDALRHSDVTYNTIDSTLWFLIGISLYSKNYNESQFFEKYKKAIDRALLWVKYRDMSEDLLPEQLPTTDWQDAFPHKYGHVINTIALYYQALRLLGQHNTASKIKKIVNGESEFPHLCLFDKYKGYYLPWIWKDHDGDREQEDWFDSLGNLLAIVGGLANQTQAEQIISYIESNKIELPYPVKCIYPAIVNESPLWRSYFEKCDARDPYHYLNAGIWPFIGGFYVAALVKIGQHKKAQLNLEKLAQANFKGRKIEWEFNEWLDGQSGEAKGGVYQAWSAGSYIFAYESVKSDKVPHFI